ncbi:Methylated-DNA--protein-cysteine methyltransferase, constitutive [compost metagenome]
MWQALSRIPYGVVCSYKDIGQAVDSVKAVRAVGGANNQNPVPIIVPCHRVIGANGSLVGYGGGLNVKTFLLQHEGYKI